MLKIMLFLEDLLKAVMFNPMGMAIFDMSIANNYYKLAQEKRIGTTLEDY